MLASLSLYSGNLSLINLFDIKGRVKHKTMLASGISHGSGVGWPGVVCRGLTGLTAQPWMASDLCFVTPVG